MIPPAPPAPAPRAPQAVASIALLALAAFGCGAAPAAPARSTGSARQAVVGGTLDSGDPAVVALVDPRARCAGEAPFLCSGTLVAPRVVLTAAHCLNAFGVQGGYEVFFGSRVGASDGQSLPVVAARQYPAYDPHSQEYDLALLRLAGPAPVDPVQVPAAPLPVAEGQEVRVVGFGDAAAQDPSTGVKREGRMTVSLMTTTGMRSTPAPGMSCAGDSGGPVLATVDGREQLFAVTVSGDSGCQTYAFNARADTVVGDFILPFIDETGQLPPVDGQAEPAAGVCPGGCSAAGAGPPGAGLLWLALALVKTARKQARAGRHSTGTATHPSGQSVTSG